MRFQFFVSVISNALDSKCSATRTYLYGEDGLAKEEASAGQKFNREIVESIEVGWEVI
jgi:hypothetical protein